MLKEYLKENKYSIYALARQCGMSYSTLNDLVNHKTPIENLKSGHLYSLSRALGMSMEEFYHLAEFSLNIESEAHNTSGRVYVKKKSYYLSVEHNGMTHERYLFPVNSQSSKYVDTQALWEMEEVLDELELEDAYAVLCSKKEG